MADADDGHKAESPTVAMQGAKSEDDRISMDLPRVGWDASCGVTLGGGLILLLVGLLRSWVANLGGVHLPAILFWGPTFLGAWLVWHGFTRSFLATRIELSPSSGVVERRLGPFRSSIRMNPRTLQVEPPKDHDDENVLRIAFFEPSGEARQTRILRARTATERERLMAAIKAWREKHRPS